jgi:hypothetical protein
MFNFLNPQRRKLGFALFSVIFAGILFIVKPARADVVVTLIDGVASLIARLLQTIIDWLGQLFLSLVEQLVKVAQYNDFLNSQAVQTGWVIVRDVANMFFVVILLVIAIATILHLESYNYKKMLPKFLLMAILINFSKTICGIVIDFSQVIMLTFVNAFKAAAGANFVMAFGIDKVYALATAEGLSGPLSLLSSLLLGLVVLLIALSTVGVLLVMLIARIIVLWVLIILSPLAFLGYSFPAGESIWKEWKENFSKYVITGPMMAFFMWLALVVAGAGTGNVQVGVTEGGALTAEQQLRVGAGALGTMERLSSVIVATAMLLIGLYVAKKGGVVGSGLADKALTKAKEAGTYPWRKGKELGKRGWGATKAGMKDSYNRFSDATYGATGFALPGSQLRAGIKEEAKKSVSNQRQARGMGIAAERTAGGRFFLAGLGDPRIKAKMTMAEKARLLMGKQDAKDKMQRIADGYAGKAATKMYAEDPYQAEVLHQQTTAAMGRARAKDDVRERTSLEGSIQGKQKDMVGIDAELASIDTARRRQGLSDADLQRDIARERAEEQVAKEEKRTPMTGQERNDRVRDLVSQNLSDIDPGKERSRIEATLRDADEKEGKLLYKKERLSDSVNLDTSNLEKVKLRLENPDEAKSRTMFGRNQAGDAIERLSGEQIRNTEALKRLADAESQRTLTRPERDRKFDLETRQQEIRMDINNNQQTINNADIELRQIEKASGLKKAQEAEEFFKMPYGQQLAQAKSNATRSAESEFFKSLAKAQRDGHIDAAQLNSLITASGRNLADARQRLDTFVQQATAAAAPAPAQAPAPAPARNP